ncbi:type VI secretion system protein ImpA [Andreprevotia lacus DSM 23236]|jgi:type VI secretion system protein ImpA|uniref:Type VI secretion system protein ImpA n=1 Tax=Andreprevotia lacus DSM 23236 TaxID=1121001 RepID=A0A1W1XM55_9NEIS|nr:type VI secretion system protein TssA [Andreprevotia lacus]SMC25006.1 type VI secretion system protein ImpA [Andreprevotia lacus DSM 23236]
MTLDTLLAPVSNELPAGANLEYAPEFMEIETAAQETPEQQFGDTIIAATPPDWVRILENCQQIFSKTKDLRIAAILCRALVFKQGIKGLEQGLALVAGLLDQYWETLHPELEDGDATFRMNSVSALASPDFLLKELRRAVFFHSKGAPPIRVSEVEALFTPGASGELTDAELQLQLNSNPEALAELAQQLASSLDSLARIKARLADQAPEHQNTLEVLAQLLARLQHKLPGVLATAEQPTDGEIDFANDAESVASITTEPGVIRSRADVDRQLEAICSYLERAEPSNPAPLLLRRAQRILSMDFIDIIRELTPDSVGHIEMLAGINR